MDKKIQRTQTHISKQAPGSVELSVVARIGMVRQYPMTKEETEAWTEMIFKLEPDITVDELKKIIEGFMTGKYEFDKELGIRNVFKALKRLRNGDREETIFNIP